MVAEVGLKIPEVLRITGSLPIERLWLFGSALGHKRFDVDSDVDFLAEIDRTKTFEKGFSDPFWQLWFKLADLFEPRRIQVVELADIRDPFFLSAVTKTRQLIYERSPIQAAG